MLTEVEWDKKLNIRTQGRDDTGEDAHHFPYEPTPYSVLERLADRGYIEKESIVVDYGCGKGRVSFFLNRIVGCETIGVEFNETILRDALENQRTITEKKKVQFFCKDAAEFLVESADCFYFFNPFSVEVLQSVLGRIFDSFYENPRKVTLFFYYPNDEYVAHLMTTEEMMFVDEIDCQDLFEGRNERERILIFEVGVDT